MSIAYPVTLPAHTGIASIGFRMVNTNAVSESPFTGVQQVQGYSRQRWEVDVTLPPLKHADAVQWIAFLASLRGRFGTFTLGDPMATSPAGTATSATVTGAAGDQSVTVTMTGTLLAGDYIQIGTGLHRVLVNRSGSGTLEIWPALRTAASAVAAVLVNPVGRFRLMADDPAWNVNSASIYGISFTAMEAF
jgi:hypothetical protein